MRVVVANNFYYVRGGSERVMFNEIASLTGAGHEVIAFSRQCAQNFSTPYEHYFQPMDEYGETGTLGRFKSALNIVYSVEQRNALGRMLDDISPSVVHGHNIYGGLTFSIVHAAKKRGIPFVLTVHDYKRVCPSYLMLSKGRVCERCLGGRFWHCAAQRCHKESLAASFVYMMDAYVNTWNGCYDSVSKFICPSRFMLDKLRAGGVPEEKLAFMPYPVPTTYEPSFEPGQYVLFAGRLSKEKGVLTLLRAFKDLHVPLKIVGTGPVEPEAKSYAEKHGMNHVSFEGYCSGENLEDLYRRSAFTVIPSEWYENSPMSILESFAYGKPVVGSRIGGIPELVVPEMTGSLFEPGDEEGLRQSVNALWHDKGKIGELGRVARMRIENEFCAEKHVKSLVNLYNDLISNS